MRLKWLEKFGYADNLFSSIRPLIMILYLNGLAPFCLVGRDKLVIAKSGFLLSLAYFLGYTVTYTTTLARGQTIIGYFLNNDISKVGNVIEMTTSPFEVITCGLYCLYKRKDLLSCLDTISLVDYRLKLLGLKLNYNYHLFYSYLLAIGLFIFSFTYLTVGYIMLKLSGVNPAFEVFCLFCMSNIEITVVVLVFIAVTKLLQFRFKMLNRILKNLLEEHSHYSTPQILYEQDSSPKIFCLGKVTHFSATKISPANIVREVTNIHNLLHDSCRLGENYFSYQMLVIITVSFLFIIFDDYYILDILLTTRNIKPKFNVDTFVIFLSSQMFLYSLMIIAIVESSSRTIEQNDELAIHVHKLLQRTTDKDVEDKLNKLSMQLIHRKVRFSAGGLFYLDRTFIFTLAGSITTYLVILLQFGNSSDSGGSCCALTNCTSLN